LLTRDRGSALFVAVRGLDERDGAEVDAQGAPARLLGIDPAAVAADGREVAARPIRATPALLGKAAAPERLDLVDLGGDGAPDLDLWTPGETRATLRRRGRDRALGAAEALDLDGGKVVAVAPSGPAGRQALAVLVARPLGGSGALAHRVLVFSQDG